MLNIYICDGYTDEGYIAARPGFWDQPLNFTYRPMIPEKRDSLLSAIGKAVPSKAIEMIALSLDEHIESWDLCDSKGEPVPKNSGNLRKLRPRLFDHLFAIVAGSEPSDPKPGQIPEDDGEDYAAQLEKRMEADAKN